VVRACVCVVCVCVVCVCVCVVCACLRGACVCLCCVCFVCVYVIIWSCNTFFVICKYFFLSFGTEEGISFVPVSPGQSLYYMF